MDRAFRYAGCTITIGLIAYLAIGALVALFLAIQSTCLVCSIYVGFVWPLWLVGAVTPG